MSNISISIITATHNRSELLKRLYESLKKQTDRSFEWIVIDDDSSDDTWNVLNRFDTDFFTIKKRRVPHGGKHRALNRGISLTEGQLTFIVDDDDWLVPNAVETILKYHALYGNLAGICGYSFLRKYPNGEINTNEFSENIVIASYVQARVNSKARNVVGDRAEVYFTDILKKNPFPEFEGEYFYFEDGLWVRLSEKYKMVHVNEAIYVCDYLSDGLTNNGRKNKILSPKGMVDRTSVFLNTPEKVRLLIIVKMTILWLTYNMFLKKNIVDLLVSSNRKLITFLCMPIAKVLYCKWRTEFND